MRARSRDPRHLVATRQASHNMLVRLVQLVQVGRFLGEVTSAPRGLGHWGSLTHCLRAFACRHLAAGDYTHSSPKIRLTSPSEEAILRAIGCQPPRIGQGACHDATIHQHLLLPNPCSSLLPQAHRCPRPDIWPVLASVCT